MRVLLVEPYYEGSHRAWADGYVMHSAHDVRLITHPGRWWKWRMRGAAVTLAASLQTLDGWRPDVVVVSDMIDLAHFRALARPTIDDAPVAIYFHESQLTYPDPPGVPADPPMRSPTGSPRTPLTTCSSIPTTTATSSSGPYPVSCAGSPTTATTGSSSRWTPEAACFLSESISPGYPTGSQRSGPPRILWNHRWEYDKEPDAFADAVERLVDFDIDFELVLLGARPKTPPTLGRIKDTAGERTVHDGTAPTSTYRKLLAESDIVVSTPRQEFFGVSVVEAITAGCRPVLPNRLSYPWLIPEHHHERVLYQEGHLFPALVNALADPSPPEDLAETMNQFSWEEMAPLYDARLESLVR